LIFGYLMDALTVFGFLSVSAMLLFYSLEPRGAIYSLAFALACWAAAIYGWLAGTWPFALVELVWGGVAARRFASRRSSRVS
jgi:hypothetical protein